MKFNIKARTGMLIVLFTLLTSGTFAQTIDLNDKNPVIDYDKTITHINQYDLVKPIAVKYQDISIKLDDIQIILEFNQTNLVNMYESDKVAQLNLEFSKEDVIYLFDNYKTMSNFDKFKFMIRQDMSFRDIMFFSSIAMVVY